MNKTAWLREVMGQFLNRHNYVVYASQTLYSRATVSLSFFLLFFTTLTLYRSIPQPFSCRGTSGTIMIIWQNLKQNLFHFSGNQITDFRNLSWKPLLYLQTDNSSKPIFLYQYPLGIIHRLSHYAFIFLRNKTQIRSILFIPFFGNPRKNKLK